MQLTLMQELKHMCQGVVRENEPLDGHTTWGIGGPADMFVYPAGKEDLRSLVRFCATHEVPYFIMGNGSNLLVSDAGFRGVVVSLNQLPGPVKTSGTKITIGAGTSLRKLVRSAMVNGLAGLENLCGIPGTIGGSLATNAGAKDQAIGDRVTDLEMLQRDGTFMHMPRESFLFAYRSSTVRQQGMVWEATFQLVRRPVQEIKVAVRTIMRQRMAKQPLREKTAGSVFKNPANDFAGRLIEACGCKGWSEGDAMVSPKHANFIVNRNRARACEVLRLMERVKNQVARETGVELEPEVELVA